MKYKSSFYRSTHAYFIYCVIFCQKVQVAALNIFFSILIKLDIYISCALGAQNNLLGCFRLEKITNYKFYSLHLWNCKCIYNICRICHIGLNRQFAHVWWQIRSSKVNIYHTMKHLRIQWKKIGIWLENIQLMNKIFQFYQIRGFKRFVFGRKMFLYINHRIELET